MHYFKLYKKYLAFVVLLTFALSVPLYADGPKAAADFTLNDQAGNAVTLSDHQGKVVVLEWVNPDCPFTKRHYAPEARTVAKLAEHYKDKNVVFLAINSTHYFDQEKNKQWHDGHKLTYPVLDDHEGKVGRIYGAKTTPHIFIVDTAGKLAYQGAIDDNPYGDKAVDSVVNYIKVTVDDLLAGKTPAISETKPYGCSVKYAN
ncbi:MAG: redoxin domain-containing protein [Sedimentisphaerales bacterium]|nr:redoxin domain-containing protein [Sedimentisphaerales bacterium]